MAKNKSPETATEVPVTPALPEWASDHQHSSSDRLPARPFKTKHENGTVTEHN